MNLYTLPIEFESRVMSVVYFIGQARKFFPRKTPTLKSWYATRTDDDVHILLRDNECAPSTLDRCRVEGVTLSYEQTFFRFVPGQKHIRFIKLFSAHKLLFPGIVTSLFLYCNNLCSNNYESCWSRWHCPLLNAKVLRQ